MSSEDFAVRLRPQDADALLAAAEAAINAGLSFGPGLHASTVNEAARRIEAVADLHRQGVADPTPDQLCPHGCVNGVITADEGTSSYCPIHGPTPDQPEQERCPFCGGEEHPLIEAMGVKLRGCPAIPRDFVVYDNYPPRVDPAPPSLHQRIEGLIAEFEEAAEVADSDFMRYDGEVDDARCSTWKHAASRLRAVLKAENEGDCTCEPAVGRGAHRVEGEIRRDCPTHGEHGVLKGEGA